MAQSRFTQMLEEHKRRQNQQGTMGGASFRGAETIQDIAGMQGVGLGGTLDAEMGSRQFRAGRQWNSGGGVRIDDMQYLDRQEGPASTGTMGGAALTIRNPDLDRYSEDYVRQMNIPQEIFTHSPTTQAAVQRRAIVPQAPIEGESDTIVSPLITNTMPGFNFDPELPVAARPTGSPLDDEILEMYRQAESSVPQVPDTEGRMRKLVEEVRSGNGIYSQEALDAVGNIQAEARGGDGIYSQKQLDQVASVQQEGQQYSRDREAGIQAIKDRQLFDTLEGTMRLSDGTSVGLTTDGGRVPLTPEQVQGFEEFTQRGREFVNPNDNSIVSTPTMTGLRGTGVPGELVSVPMNSTGAQTIAPSSLLQQDKEAQQNFINSPEGRASSSQMLRSVINSPYSQQSQARQERIGGTGSFAGDSAAREQRIADRPDFGAAVSDRERRGTGEMSMAEATRLAGGDREEARAMIERQRQGMGEFEQEQDNRTPAQIESEQLKIEQQRLNVEEARRRLQEPNLSAVERIQAQGTVAGLPENLTRQAIASELKLDITDSAVRNWIDGNTDTVPTGGAGESTDSQAQDGGSTPPASTIPKAGDIKQGFRFKGGDPSKKENWEKV